MVKTAPDTFATGWPSPSCQDYLYKFSPPSFVCDADSYSLPVNANKMMTIIAPSQKFLSQLSFSQHNQINDCLLCEPVQLPPSYFAYWSLQFIFSELMLFIDTSKTISFLFWYSGSIRLNNPKSGINLVEPDLQASNCDFVVIVVLVVNSSSCSSRSSSSSSSINIYII